MYCSKCDDYVYDMDVDQICKQVDSQVSHKQQGECERRGYEKMHEGIAVFSILLHVQYAVQTVIIGVIFPPLFQLHLDLFSLCTLIVHVIS